MFKLPERFATFELDGDEWAGAEIVCRLSPIRIKDVIFGPEQTAAELIEAWAKIALVSWNLTQPDGTAIPCDMEGLGYLPGPTQLALVEAWLGEVAGIPAPLLKRSSGGAGSDPAEPTNPPS